MIVLVSFSAVSLMLTAATPVSAQVFCPLIYCIPIILAALWFPRQAFRATALLVAGFVIIRVHLSALGFAVDPVMTGLHTMIFFWVFGATTLFSQDAHLAASRCRRIVEDTRDARFLCDPETLRVVCASRKCADMLGYAPRELVGIPAEAFWADESGKIRFIEEMKREGYVGNVEMTFYAQNGDARRVLLSCRALAPENLFECTVVDTGRLLGENDELVRSNGRLMELIRQTNDIFFMQDAAGCILHFSWVRAPEYGISPEEIVGKGVDTLLPADLAAQNMEQIRKVIAEQKNACYDLDLEIAGARHTFSVTIAPYNGVDGAFAGIVGSARDTTEVRRQRLACRQLSWEVEQWKELVTRLAHELRTPLQPLVGYLRMIVEDPGYYGLTKDTEAALRTCLECADQEQAVVERVVELSLLTMDYVDLTVQDVPLRELVDTAVSEGGYEHSARICNEIPDNVHILGDPDRLSMAVAGLVSNAVKYNEPPEKVWIRYTRSNENHYIMVCDNGIGIPGDIIESIFEPFYIGDARQDREGGSTGLGLSIANKYVLLHGGDITVTSEVGEGSTFTIRIPREV
ncbi:PAS domain-containing sensor histidine kinase [Methanoculleus sp. MH98A]|uniref:PAS domain-containing sensor histidine kinase n=1 Tax=Methanoculleus sp. MH98A TaxID=1495314 RepID=UPI001E3F1B41|nr:PAS domain-containing sensor histidine kinase [Methanoculleus sp. MH98A]